MRRLQGLHSEVLVKTRLTLIIDVEHEPCEIRLGNENLAKSVTAAVFGVHARLTDAKWFLVFPEFTSTESLSDTKGEEQ